MNIIEKMLEVLNFTNVIDIMSQVLISLIAIYPYIIIINIVQFIFYIIRKKYGNNF